MELFNSVDLELLKTYVKERPQAALAAYKESVFVGDENAENCLFTSFLKIDFKILEKLENQIFSAFDSLDYLDKLLFETDDIYGEAYGSCERITGTENKDRVKQLIFEKSVKNIRLFNRFKEFKEALTEFLDELNR